VVGRRNWLTPGAIWPRSDGPRAIPAMTSPITGGCWMNLNAAPNARAARITTVNASRTCINVSDAGGVAAAALSTCSASGATRPAPYERRKRAAATVPPIIVP
jgi:hypothetical protein